MPRVYSDSRQSRQNTATSTVRDLRQSERESTLHNWQLKIDDLFDIRQSKLHDAEATIQDNGQPTSPDWRRHWGRIFDKLWTEFTDGNIKKKNDAKTAKIDEIKLDSTIWRECENVPKNALYNTVQCMSIESSQIYCTNASQRAKRRLYKYLSVDNVVWLARVQTVHAPN